MGIRYDNRQTVQVLKNYYKSFLDKRNLKNVNIYKTPILPYPTPGQANNLNSIRHTWGTGDRYYKLAYKYYGDKELWWVIAHFNQKPTESHVSPGDVVFIPYPLDSVLYYMGY